MTVHASGRFHLSARQKSPYRLSDRREQPVVSVFTDLLCTVTCRQSENLTFAPRKTCGIPQQPHASTLSRSQQLNYIRTPFFVQVLFICPGKNYVFYYEHTGNCPLNRPVSACRYSCTKVLPSKSPSSVRALCFYPLSPCFTFKVYAQLRPSAEHILSPALPLLSHIPQSV